MDFRIIDLTAAHPLRVWGDGVSVQVLAEPEIALGPNEVGLIIGKHSHHQKGISCFQGLVNPGWSGRLTIEFTVHGTLELKVGDKIAHLVILSQPTSHIVTGWGNSSAVDVKVTSLNTSFSGGVPSGQIDDLGVNAPG